MAHRWKQITGFLFGRNLFITNTLSCGSLLVVGDAATQFLERWSGNSKLKRHDWSRTARMFLIGTVMGPLNHGWYTFLDKALVGTATKTVVKKILLDQICASPVFAFSYFMGLGTLEGQPIGASWVEFKSKFWDVYKADWMLWPAAQAINFYLLPTHYRVVYVASVTCVWNSFLSFIKHKDDFHLDMAMISSLKQKYQSANASNIDSHKSKEESLCSLRTKDLDT